MVVYFQHETNCPKIQISCPACFTLILRKNIEVRFFYFFFLRTGIYKYLLWYVFISSQNNELKNERKNVIISNSILHRLNTLETLYYTYFINPHSLFTLVISIFFIDDKEHLSRSFKTQPPCTNRILLF